MDYALIKDSKCINIIVFNDEEKAQAFKDIMIADKIIDDMVVPVTGFEIGDKYINGDWSKKEESTPVVQEPTFEKRLIIAEDTINFLLGL